ncbi:hypothetical protein TraAM80_01610 [Trypanosoma rangeli]|uniref:Meckel syndrome type 1 protein n=1 Tax=Trypanosoma rangeli TaxID=5698 RepID=A0A3R7NZK7_TRYRA|nr:uncharacterized protein TraAM80_01610 [Trypanosoma rangeli]RNF10267.1 hypothetical protein TraAM80_01610 [Trypanosoma rangeli]|eukprot:RNF10267.1 hypothetical protein TraAM80_01610 [Trypanosoma rangeli]
MDLFRFKSAQQYASRVPLRKLSFRVTLWRALLVEENHTEVLCSVTVPWDGKLFSPAENLEMIRAVDAEATAGDVARTSLGAGATEVDMETLRLQGSGRAIPDAVRAATELRRHLEKSADALFTHTSSEDYICEAEEDCPVDPPQEPSPLAAVILRQYHTQHQTSNKMYFMWAIGGITPPDGASLSEMRWEGEERVVCIITADTNEFYFTAKPSINETHTLFVDSLHVYSLKVSAMATEETALAPSEPDGIIQRVGNLASRVENTLDIPHSARREALQQLLLQQASTMGAAEVDFDVKHLPQAGVWDSFTRHASRARVHHYIYGTIDRCVGVSEEAIYLHCQWRQGTQEEETCEVGKVGDGFTTQLTLAGTILVEDFIPLPVHTFNTPFEYHLNVEDMAPLQLLVTVYSESVYAQQAPVGYTVLTVPHTQPGCHTLRAPFWRPWQTGREFLCTALVGGAPALVDPWDAATRGNAGMSVKHGLVTEPTGEVEVRVMVLHQYGIFGS